jgi:hypothetical protein
MVATKATRTLNRLSLLIRGPGQPSCARSVSPHSMQVGLTAIDDGQVYDSTVQ